jgi:hypothetical protein
MLIYYLPFKPGILYEKAVSCNTLIIVCMLKYFHGRAVIGTELVESGNPSRSKEIKVHSLNVGLSRHM